MGGRAVRLMGRGLAGAAVLAAVAWAYWGVLDADFVGWDDGGYVTGNYRIQQWGWEYFKDYFRMQPKWGPMPNAQYTPLVETVFAVEYKLAGLNPRVFHGTNLALHLVTTVLVGWVAGLLWGIRRANGRGLCPRAPDAGETNGWWVGVVCAALFGLHPLHVESVAWVTELKDVLSGVFFVGAMGLYLLGKRSADGRASGGGGRKWGWWGASVGAMFLGVLSKQVAVMVPGCLVLCDWLVEGGLGWKGWARRIAGKWAWWAVAGFGVWAALYSHAVGGALPGGAAANWSENVLVAGRGVVQYVWTYVWPFALSALYTLPPWEELPKAWFALCAVGVVVATAGLWAARKRVPVAFWGWAFFLVALAPSSRLVAIGLRVLSADRFFYVPGIGFVVATGWGLVCAWNHGGAWGWTAAAAFLALCVAWGWGTRERTKIWMNDDALWDSMAETAEDSPIPLVGQGWAELFAKQSPSNAVEKAFAALDRTPGDPGALSLLSEVAYQRGELNKFMKFAGYAEDVSGDVLKSRPRVAWAMVLQGREKEAEELLLSVLEKQPLAAQYWTQLGWTRWHGGDDVGAVKALNRAAELAPLARKCAAALARGGGRKVSMVAPSDATVRLGWEDLSEVEKALAASDGWFALQYTAGQDEHLVLDRKTGAKEEEERLAKVMERLLPVWDSVREDEEADVRMRLWAAEVHRKTAVTLYNLGCLACKEREVEKAKGWLEKAFGLDEGLREDALVDEDLEEMKKWVEEGAEREESDCQGSQERKRGDSLEKSFLRFFHSETFTEHEVTA